MKRTIRLKCRGRVHSIEVDGSEPASRRATVVPAAGGAWVSLDGHCEFFEPVRGATPLPPRASDPNVRAPMTGRIVAVRVKPGDEVKTGDVLVTLEAMKMEYRLAASTGGKVASVKCAAGDRVEIGALLVTLETA
ncbi:MAG TPA: acetyl-CoA carboxylase biotin carboxyl carrier protein subunit [Planctomycetota bacterium]|nr:acetyl-CoA carboxylase biotin carboxyl carrier protein subunit [Planctomycetota bacterium]